jgi:hypothetical protein
MTIFLKIIAYFTPITLAFLYVFKQGVKASIAAWVYDGDGKQFVKLDGEVKVKVIGET